MTSLLNYNYYDSPEGHDIFKKTFVTAKYGAITGGLMGTMDVLMYSRPQGIFKTGSRYLFYIGPLVGMASAFTVTTNVAQNYRGKNDGINYFLGGVAAGSIFGAWTKSGLGGFSAALFLGVCGMVKKMAIDHGYEFFAEIPQMKENAVSVKHDWSLVKDLPQHKTYTTGPVSS